jgi:predicted DNA-binding protein (UPF0251 family)
MADTSTMAPDDAAARTEDRARIQRALEALPEHHRTIIMLSDLEGLSYREIAEVLNIPMGTVMSRLHNARKRLRDALGPLLAIVLALVALLAPLVYGGDQVVRFGARVLLASDGPPAPGLRVAPAAPDERLEKFLPKLRRPPARGHAGRRGRQDGAAPSAAGPERPQRGDHEHPGLTGKPRCHRRTAARGRRPHHHRVGESQPLTARTKGTVDGGGA